MLKSLMDAITFIIDAILGYDVILPIGQDCEDPQWPE
jgi:hypothetical protein